VVAASEALAALGAVLSEPARAVSWETHQGVGKRPISAHLVLVADFPDEAALEAYQTDPQHRLVAAQLREVFDLVSGDYEH
jgi:hypothetical protein